MSVTGIALILFLTFHCCMNIVALFSEEGYNMICEFLGANWYAVVATLGLAALAVIHIVFAFILTAQNRTARGDNRYEVATTVNAGKVEWASKNMLVLGIIVLLGLLLHLFNFWYNMMFAEIFGIVGSLTLCSPSSILFGWLLSGSIFLTDSGQLCRRSAGMARPGSAAGRLSASSTCRCLSWASSSSCSPSGSDALPHSVMVAAALNC